MAKDSYEIVVLPGDGIGKDVMPEAIKVLKAVSRKKEFEVNLIEFECGAQYYQKTGKEWENNAFDSCKQADAILLGAVGWPGVSLPDGNIAGAGIVFGLRFGLDLYANVRPTKLYQGVLHSVHGEKRQIWKHGLVDLITVRENTEGLYAPARGKLERGGFQELALDTRIITEKGARRVIKYAFELSKRKEKGAPKDGKKRVTCVDKSNVLEGCRLFRNIYDEVAEGYPEVERDYAYIDAYTQWLVRDPDYYQVVVTTNMLGDIASDLSSVLAGSLGMAPSGNIGDRHAFFEPVHGSAPKHAGKNKANPFAMILSAAMMLDHLGHRFGDQVLVESAKDIESAVEKVIAKGSVLTYDLGGSSSTKEVGDAVVKLI